jgi:hypothetical protein
MQGWCNLWKLVETGIPPYEVSAALVLWESIWTAYLDDILIYSDSLENNVYESQEKWDRDSRKGMATVVSQQLTSLTKRHSTTADDKRVVGERR